MLTSDLVRKIRRIEISTRRVVTDNFAGRYQGSFELRSQSSALVEDRGDGDAAISQTIVVVADSVDVMSGQGAQYVAEGALPAGAEAELLERRAHGPELRCPVAASRVGYPPAP